MISRKKLSKGGRKIKSTASPATLFPPSNTDVTRIETHGLELVTAQIWYWEDNKERSYFCGYFPDIRSARTACSGLLEDYESVYGRTAHLDIRSIRIGPRNSFIAFDREWTYAERDIGR